MEEQLVARLLGTPTLSALVGNRITWGERVKKETLPAITMLGVSPGRNYVHGGADPTGNPRVQFDCYGTTAAQAKATARALRDTLETSATQGGIAFSVALLDAERGPLIEDTGGGLKVHRYSLDFFVWFSPAA
ncbi:MAG: DUF3168 domain-containing protein [Sphingomonas sp.]|jgi:hypothetical protein